MVPIWVISMVGCLYLVTTYLLLRLAISAKRGGVGHWFDWFYGALVGAIALFLSLGPWLL